MAGMRLTRRESLRRLVASGAGVALTGCAGWMGGDPLHVSLVDLEPLPSEGLEVRMAAKLRVQNPSNAAIDYDGCFVELSIRGASFASGVSNEAGRIERFGEVLITIPVSISALAVLRQAISMAGNKSTRIDYTLRGRLAGTGIGGTRFESSGEIELPKGLGAR